MDFDQRRLLLLGGHLHFPPRELWWQRHDGAPQRLDTHKLVSAATEILSGPRPAPSPEPSFADLCWSIAADGWRAGEQIRAAINQHGQILITDGLHRSSAALVAGMETIPVQVVFRADEWIALKYALLAANEDRLPLYQPVEHPDFSGSGWTVHRTDTARRVKLIAADLQAHHASAKSGLDYACNAGVLTIGLARLGFRMRGVDTNAHAILAAQLMAPMRQLGAPDNPPHFALCPAAGEQLPPRTSSWSSPCSITTKRSPPGTKRASRSSGGASRAPLSSTSTPPRRGSP